MTDPAKVTVELTVHFVCLGGEENCDAPKCPCGCTHEDMIPLADEPSVRICLDCGKAYIVRTCETCEDIAERRKRGIGPDCPSCMGTGIGRTPEHVCGRCFGVGYDKIREED